jgi:homeobox protein ESX1
VLPELVQLEPLALPDLAPEAVTGLAEAEPVEPPLPESPDVGAEFTVAGPVEPVDPVLPELPDCAVEFESQERATHGATLTAGPVLPEFPELPESPELAELPLELASPVLPESALPDLAVVLLEAEELASPLCPPVAEPSAELSPELPEVAVGEPVAEDEPELPDVS